MFRPNITVEVRKQMGTSLHGKRQYGAPTKVRAAFIWLEESDTKTSVRTDSSGSRGGARESIAKARMLVLPATILKAGDRVSFMGHELSVMSVFPRHGVEGRFDHWQVDLEFWGG